MSRTVASYWWSKTSGRCTGAPVSDAREERGVEVGQQPVAQLDRLAHDGRARRSPHAHAYWSTLPISEWLRQNGVSAPYCIQRRNSSALELPCEAADVGADERLAGDAEARSPSACSPTGGPSATGCRPSSSPRSAGCRRTRRGRARTCACRASPRAGRRPCPSPSAARTGCGSARASRGRGRSASASGGDRAGGGLVHVVPDAGQAGLHVRGVELAPPARAPPR